MMRAPLIAIVLSGVSAAVCAQSANETVAGLESCFKLARQADSICANPANDATQRVDCLQKARRAQLECLEHVPAETTAGSGPSQMSTGTVRADLPTATVAPGVTARSAAPEMPARSAAPEAPAKAVDVPSRARDANWIVSETTSPVDYTPLISAAVRLPFSVKHAPNMLAIRCRGQRTELLVRTEGTWRASRSGEVHVDHQINDQPVVRLAWTASADGRTAIYKDDAVGFLQSLPEDGRLKIDVIDGPGPSHEATFQLAGLDSVRQKIAAACQWPPVANKQTSERR